MFGWKGHLGQSNQNMVRGIRECGFHMIALLGSCPRLRAPDELLTLLHDHYDTFPHQNSGRLGLAHSSTAGSLWPMPGLHLEILQRLDVPVGAWQICWQDPMAWDLDGDGRCNNDAGRTCDSGQQEPKLRFCSLGRSYTKSSLTWIQHQLVHLHMLNMSR